MNYKSYLRRKHFKKGIRVILIILLILLLFNPLRFDSVKDRFDILIIGAFCIGIYLFFDRKALVSLIRLININSSPIYKRFRSFEEASRIYKYVMNNKEYEDKNFIISRKYILDKHDLENFFIVSDITNINKCRYSVKGYNIAYLSLEIIDKYDKTTINYKNEKYDELNIAMLVIASKCKAAFIRYESKTQSLDKVKKVIRQLNKDKSIYYCPKCNNEIEYKTLRCDKCGAIFNFKEKQIINSNDFVDALMRFSIASGFEMQKELDLKFDERASLKFEFVTLAYIPSLFMAYLKNILKEDRYSELDTNVEEAGIYYTKIFSKEYGINYMTSTNDFMDMYDKAKRIAEDCFEDKTFKDKSFISSYILAFSKKEDNLLRMKLQMFVLGTILKTVIIMFDKVELV